ncbi:hypothetical protein WN51_06533 [Melipona quadrifasciata]|uniref:Uncharacterized protein n=1 Tax=Melipona quadrifasciata TaxID=166423 RepID=A0A0M8ZRT0_9HYME|nr:hypothetical protein WN51_06533 [Melipona quadrifasciata]
MKEWWNARQIIKEMFLARGHNPDCSINIPTTWTQVTVSAGPLMGPTVNTTRQHPLSDPLRGKDVTRVTFLEGLVFDSPRLVSAQSAVIYCVWRKHNPDCSINIPTTWTQVTVSAGPLMGPTVNTTRQHPLSDPLRGKDITTPAFRSLEGKGHSESQGIKELTPMR